MSLDGSYNFAITLLFPTWSATGGRNVEKKTRLILGCRQYVGVINSQEITVLGSHICANCQTASILFQSCLSYQEHPV